MSSEQDSFEKISNMFRSVDNRVDYVGSYLTPETFDLPRLLNDDFFRAIQLTFNGRCYVSSAKLLLSFIDTVGYLEFGDTVPCPFKSWLELYGDLSPVGVSTDELWEFRNGLLHMTNPDSRKVKRQQIVGLMFYVGDLPRKHVPKADGIRYFDLWALILGIAGASEKFCKSFIGHPEKIEIFMDRYDGILSDTRMLFLHRHE